MYDKWQAQKWWGDNNERIMELYNVRRFSRQVLPTPPRSDDGEVSRCRCLCLAAACMSLSFPCRTRDTVTLTCHATPRHRFPPYAEQDKNRPVALLSSRPILGAGAGAVRPLHACIHPWRFRIERRKDQSIISTNITKIVCVP